MMKAMSLSEITTACHGQYYGDPSLLSKAVNGVAIDSRKIEQDFLFVPIKGARVDGHDFIPQVMKAGALCTLSEHLLETPEGPYILVSSCEQALKDLAEHYRKALGIPVVGITGSVGKTSTKEMIASVLSTRYRVLKTAGNFNNEIGVPLTIFQIREEHEIAILEMGINHFEEMHHLSKIARPDVCVITNIGYCHLEHLIDRDGVLKAKTEMFDYMNPNATIILNGEDDKLLTIQNWDGYAPKYFGLSTDSDAYATDIHSLSLKGTSFTLHIKDQAFPVLVPIPGHHMVYNALAGALVGAHFGLTCEEIQQGIEQLTPVAGRNNMIVTDSLFIVDDCYNANPVSMTASLDVLSTADTRKVAILGDMFELGETEKELHYQVGEHAAQKQIDVLICIGDLSKEIAHGAKDTSSQAEVLHFNTKAQFFSSMKNLIQKGDTILVKASHGMEFPEIVEKLKRDI